MRPLIHRLITAPVPGLVFRVRDRLPGRTDETRRPSRALSVPAKPEEERAPNPPRQRGPERPATPPKRPRTPGDPDRNDQAGMWPDLWAAHRC
jgi:hypothetical protein